MRFLVYEQPYEKPVAAGQLRYERNGEPTGAVEEWRLTQAAEGYRFLRVDLDARQAASGHSYLYHLMLNEQGRAEQLKFRFWSDELKVTGHVILEDDLVGATREITRPGEDEDYFEDEVSVEPAYGFWFPSGVGLGLLRRGVGETAVTLNSDQVSAAGDQLSVNSDRPALFRLQKVNVALDWGEDEKLTVMGEERSGQPLTIRWANQQRTIWLDEHGAVLKMERPDGLTAIETRHVRYR